jgi:N6-L-threonylcarbamoyladenine synthase
MADAHSLPLFLPEPDLCTDNGVMIAYTGGLLLQEGWRHGLDVACGPRGMPMPDDMAKKAQ